MILLLAWGPAILLQLAHPLIASGIADHSRFHTERRGHVRRLHRTLHSMLQLCFGSEPEARAVVARINAIHDRVSGQLPKAAGVFAVGTRYSAHDPALLAWIHATLLDMNVRLYELFVAPLALEEKDRYCAEASAIEEPLGIPRGQLPRSFSELRRYMDAMYTSGQIVVTDVARTLALGIVYPPVPALVGPLLAPVRLTAIGLLPPTIREGYGFPWGGRTEAMLHLSARLVRHALPLMPPFARYWPAARRAVRRPRGQSIISVSSAESSRSCPFAAAEDAREPRSTMRLTNHSTGRAGRPGESL
jgi:uncharacterized protein (DUF2236 family)